MKSAADDRRTAPAVAHERDNPPGHAALMDELTEALTALGVWLTAARRQAESALPPDPAASDVILAGAEGQYRRAARALRRLRAAGPPREPGRAEKTARPQGTKP